MAKSHMEKASAILRINRVNGQKAEDHRKIEETMKNLPGISKVRINYVTSTIKVNYDPEKLTLEKIKETLRTLGNDNV